METMLISFHLNTVQVNYSKLFNNRSHKARSGFDNFLPFPDSKERSNLILAAAKLDLRLFFLVVDIVIDLKL